MSSAKNNVVKLESAKLRALRAKKVLTCQRALRANVLCVLTCSRVNMPCVLTCSLAKVPCVLSWSRANFPWVPTSLTCQHALRAHVLTCQHGLRAYVLRATMHWVSCLTRLVWPRDHLPTDFVSSVSSFDSTFFSFNAIVVEVVHTVGKL